MKPLRYKPSPRVEDRRHQKGETTFAQKVENLWSNVKEGSKPESFATSARILLGYKEDPEAVRKKISSSIPDVRVPGKPLKSKRGAR